VSWFTAQALQPEGVGVVQAHRERLDGAAEGRPGYQACGRGSARALAAARAGTAEQGHARHVGPDGRDLDAVVHLLRGLRALRERRQAIRAGSKLGLDDRPMRCSRRDTDVSPYDTDQRCSMWAAMSTSR